MKDNIIILGCSGHAKVVVDIFEKQGDNVLGYVSGDPTDKVGTEFFGYEILGHDSDLPRLIKEHHPVQVFIAIGDNYLRWTVFGKTFKDAKAKFATAIHPSAQIGRGVEIEQGTCVMANAVINSDTYIGSFVIVNTGALIDHDCMMSDFSSLAPGVTIGGNVSIDCFSAVCIGATVKHGVDIGDKTVIGAGAVLLDDCENNQVLYGVPAKVIRSRKSDESYL